MAGRPYTMKEMRGIVDYIKERKAFSEVRARKMWMDFASSDLTTRTWQSLKETFLKRILPDIHNPYYKLTQYELRSFREGRVIRPSNNKLEFRSSSPETNTVVQKDNQEPSTSGIQNGHKSGEDVTCTKVNSRRESVDTIILADDDIEQTNQEDNVTSQQQRTRSLRDCITYTEPLTPMMQEILHDFTSDEEPPLTIDEEAGTNQEDIENILSQNQMQVEAQTNDPETYDSHPLNNNVADTVKDPSSSEPTKKRSLRLKSSDKNKSANVSETSDAKEQKTVKPTKKRSLRLKSADKDKSKELNASDTSDNQNKNKTRVTRSKKSDTITEEVTEKTTANKSQTPSNSITDSLIPNNQEGLLNKKSKDSMEQTLAPKEKEIQKSTRTSIESKKSDSVNEVSSSNDVKKINKEKTNEKAVTVTTETVKSIANNVDTVGKETENKMDVDNELVPSQPSSNPCLQSVSLYEEQFVSLLNSDKESDIETDEVKTKNNNKLVTEKDKSNENKVLTKEEVLYLNSDSESGSEGLKFQRKAVNPRKVTKLRSKVLKSLFDGGSKKHKRRGYRNGALCHHALNLSSESSSWTSDSEAAYVSPPRVRGRHSRKYLKPNSGRILALEQEGGLFVASGKKVFPLVKDGKLIKNYLTYDPESDDEEKEDSYWQMKYLEERKKTAELAKLLERVTTEQNRKRVSSSRMPDSPILQSKAPPKIDKSVPVDITSSNENLHGSEIVLPKQVEEPKEEQTVKIKFAKENEEVFLEGHWQNLHHILGEVMQIFHKDKERQEPKAEHEKCPVIIEEADDEVHKKMDQLEQEIFKEIEEKDKGVEGEDNVPKATERKKRAKQPLPREDPQWPSDPKRPKTDENDRSDSEIIVNESRLKPVKETGRKRSPKKLAIESISEKPATSPRTAKTQSTAQHENINEDENETLYKFPSPEPERKTRASKGTKKLADLTKIPRVVIIRSPESTQGYQDSDASPTNNLRRKRKSITYVVQGKNKFSRNMRKKVCDFDASDESSNSLPSTVTLRKPINITTNRNMPKNITIQNVTVNTEVYRTDSYQLLMPKTKSMSTLEVVGEISPCPNEIDSVCGNNSLLLSPVSQDLSRTDKSESSISINVQLDSSNVTIPPDNSSNVSLPMSPELSIVENLSISKNVLDTIECQTETETKQSENNYLMCDVDVSVPLMVQDSTVKKDLISLMDFSEGKSDPVDTRIGSSGIGEDKTISDTLEEKIRGLILESAKKVKDTKKIAVKKQKKQPTENVPKVPKKRRSSTPRKKNQIMKLRAPSVDAVIEEQMEFCTNGRKSCPPVICNVNQYQTEINAENMKPNKPNKRPKKKKNIIKVKILKPKAKSTKNKTRKSTQPNLQVDSGINETSSGINDIDSSIELIHNHTESCIQYECFDESVVFLENSKSVISVNSTAKDVSYDMDNVEGVTPDMFSSDARDGSSAVVAPPPPSSGEPYHTPPASISSFNSLITEDLSDEIQMNKPDWYLLSDEETQNCTNTDTLLKDFNIDQDQNCTISNTDTLLNEFDQDTTYCKTSGSNLNKLFPVTCSVPNLSTITEYSRETETNTREMTVVDSVVDEFVTCSPDLNYF